MAAKKFNNVVLLLGSNMGDKTQYIKQAFYNIEEQIGSINKKSSLYKTDAWGKTDQEYFINCAASISTNFSAWEVLMHIHSIENKMGRKRNLKWEPRIIDIDILFFNDEIIKAKNLEVPHPEFTNRMFAIIPVKEIMPEILHPVYNMKIDDILAACNDKGNVTLL